MSEEELIEVLRQFDEKRVEELPEKTRNIFYAIMKIADERDELENIRKEAIEYINHATIGADSSPIEDSWLYNLYETRHILNKGDNNGFA